MSSHYIYHPIRGVTGKHGIMDSEYIQFWIGYLIAGCEAEYGAL